MCYILSFTSSSSGMFCRIRLQNGDFPMAEKASQSVLSLPIYPELTDAQKSYVVEAIKEFYQG